MMRIRSLMLLALALLAAPSFADAQIAAELRGGGAIGNHQPAAAGLETVVGPSFSALVSYEVIPLASVYGTFVRSQFGCEEGFCIDRDVTVTSTGFGGGVRVQPIPYAWGQVGALMLSTSVDTNDIDESGDGTLGYELAAGLSWPATGQFAVVPSLTYRSDLEGEGRTSLLTAEIGVRIRLP